MALLSQLPELGRLNAIETSIDMRRSLYVAVLMGTRFDATRQASYARLLTTGKAKEITLLACMHKLVSVAAMAETRSALESATTMKN